MSLFAANPANKKFLIIISDFRIIVLSTEHSLEDMMKIYHLLAEKIWSSFPQNMKATCAN